MSASTTDKIALDNQGKRIKAEDQQFEVDMGNVLSTPSGRRVIWRILSQTRFLKLSYEGNANTNFNEGQRNVGLMIYGNIIKVNPEAFLQMQAEAKLREEKKRG